MSARALQDAGYGPLISVMPPDAVLHESSNIEPTQRGKVPGLFRDGAWHGYAFTKTKVDAATIEQTGANVGLLGDNFPGLDIDCDDPKLAHAVQQFAEERLGETAVRLSREPRRLLVYRTTAPFARCALIVTFKGKSHLIEWLGAGRQYLVHGRHPSGADYRWDVIDLWDMIPSDIPEVDGDSAYAFLEELRAQLEERGIECELVGSAKSKTEAPAQPQGDLSAPSTELVAQLLKGLPNPAEWDRARYVEVAAAVKAASTDDEVAGFEAFTEWASRHPSHNPEHDRKTWDSLRPPYRMGWSWLQERAAALTGYVPAVDEFDAVDAPADEPDKYGRLGFMRVDRFLSIPRTPVQWVVEGMLPASGLSLLVAKPKVGKTTLARSLAVATAKGEPWLGRQTKQGPVLYLSLEDPDDLVQEEFERLGADGDLYVRCGIAPKDAIEILHEDALMFRPSLIIVDTLQRLYKFKDLNDYAQVTNLTESLLTLKRDSGAHVMSIHHAPKGEREDMADSPLGSTALFASVDTLLTMRRTDSDLRYLRTRQRRGEDLPDTFVFMDPETHWPCLEETRQNIESEEVAQKLREVLEAAEEPLTQKEMSELITARKTLWTGTLNVMWRRGEVKREGKGRVGDVYRYSLADSFDGLDVITEGPEAHA